MSGVFDKGGGGGGSGPKGSQNVDIPPFISSGGITPEQQALAQYGYGEDLLSQGNLFGSSGTGDSTMATQGAGGARDTAAMAETGMSDANQGAMYKLYQNDVQNQIQGLQNQITTSNQNDASLSGLASLAGFTSTGSLGTGTSGQLS